MKSRAGKDPKRISKMHLRRIERRKAKINGTVHTAAHIIRVPQYFR